MKKIRISQLTWLIIFTYIAGLALAFKIKTNFSSFAVAFTYCTAISTCLAILLYVSRRIKQIQLRDLGSGALGIGLFILVRHAGAPEIMTTLLPTFIFVGLTGYSLYKDKDDATLVINETIVNNAIASVMKKLEALQELGAECDKAGFSAAATDTCEIKRQKTAETNKVLAPYIKILSNGNLITAKTVNRDRPTAVKVTVDLYKIDNELTEYANSLIEILRKQKRYQKKEDNRSEFNTKKALDVSSFFAGCNTKEEYKKRFAALAKTYHPDSGYGDADVYMTIKEYYDKNIKRMT